MAKKKDAAEGGKSRKKMVFVVVGVLVAGFGAKTFVLGGKDEAAACAAEVPADAAGHPVETTPPVDAGRGATEVTTPVVPDGATEATADSPGAGGDHGSAAAHGPSAVFYDETGQPYPAPQPTDPCTPKPPEPGGVVKLDPITLNLADGRYLKVGLALQLSSAASAEHFAEEEGGGAKALDLAIALLGSKGYEDLATPDGRAAVKEALGSQAAAAYHGHVLTVYFTEFVMQ
ncbi:MAG: flagellar basal body-associated FliL family protein [Acidimicrobiia bacterium]|nr:flagellar basal body-associated FliL family protein [Acidimicrobiia bacterium]